jgi:hypothetical protein
MELVFMDTQYSFQTLRALGYAVSRGADIGEVLKTAYSIKEGDDESWYREWMKTVEQRETLIPFRALVGNSREFQEGRLIKPPGLPRRGVA